MNGIPSKVGDELSGIVARTIKQNFQTRVERDASDKIRDDAWFAIQVPIHRMVIMGVRRQISSLLRTLWWPL